MLENGVLFQFFSWFLPKDASIQGNDPLWIFLEKQARHLSDLGISAVWIPPAYKGWGGLGGQTTETVGYDVYDHFDLGEFANNNEATASSPKRTKYGDKVQLKSAIDELHRFNVQVYADIVVNHKFGGEPEDIFWQAVRVDPENRNDLLFGDGFERGVIEIKPYSSFDFPARGGIHSSFRWSVWHFDGFDSVSRIRQNGSEWSQDSRAYLYFPLFNGFDWIPNTKSFDEWVSLEKGNYDYLTGNDLDFDRFDVREEIKYWGRWITQELNLDGFRIDAVKHISADFIREWIGDVRASEGRDLFVAGEYIAGDTQPLHSYIERVSATGVFPQAVNLLDFPLRFKFKEASYANENYPLTELSYGTLMAEQPALAVTFVENHDYEFGRGLDSHVQDWFKPLGYTYILLRDKGYPCVFFADYYGSDLSSEFNVYPPGSNYLDILLKLRAQFALGEERFYDSRNVVGWIRNGFVPGAKGAMAAVICNAPGGTVASIRMDTGRKNRKFYHFATLKLFSGDFVVARGPYSLFGDKAGEIWTDSSGFGEFLAEGRTASIWLEEDAVLN
ncbi:MAG: alpha-amylase [Cyanobacteria bacterium P01_A01_bin.3]